MTTSPPKCPAVPTDFSEKQTTYQEDEISKETYFRSKLLSRGNK
jgi:hypothetical protein